MDRGSQNPSSFQEKTSNISITEKYEKLLQKQCKNIDNYLKLLNEEEKAIKKGDVIKIEKYKELEETTVRKIISFQNTIEPLENQYKQNPLQNDNNIIGLHKSISKKLKAALAANKQNQLLLKQEMKSIKKELKAIRKIKPNCQSPYKKIGTPKFIDYST